MPLAGKNISRLAVCFLPPPPFGQLDATESFAACYSGAIVCIFERNFLAASKLNKCLENNVEVIYSYTIILNGYLVS
jgi:hypothetical protein